MTFGCEKQSFSSERLQCFEETFDQTIAMIRMVANIFYKYNQSQGFNNSNFYYFLHNNISSLLVREGSLRNCYSQASVICCILEVNCHLNPVANL